MQTSRAGVYYHHEIIALIKLPQARRGTPKRPLPIFGASAQTFGRPRHRAPITGVARTEYRRMSVIGVTIENGTQLAFSQVCTYPDGIKVLCFALCEFKGGKIAQQTIVQAWDE